MFCYLGLSGRWNSSSGLLEVKVGNILIRGKTTGQVLMAVLGGKRHTVMLELGLDDGFARLK
jgi:hypothetical protein